MADEPIPTYLSHSYRRKDQPCNQDFWKSFEPEGFYFSVDPPSDIPSHTHLERMMKESSCYVAVVNARTGTRYGCSPFILSEFGLSVQAQRPQLLLVNNKISTREPFSKIPTEEILPFSADPLSADQTRLKRAIEDLRNRALRLPDPELRERGPIGVLVPEESADRAYGGPRVRKQIQEAARPQFECCEITVPCRHNAMFALQLRRCEAVVLDVRGDTLQPWVFAYIYGRLIPSIKLVHVGLEELASKIKLPPLVRGLQMDEDEPGVESVIYWREPDDLLHQLHAAFKKLDQGPTRLKEQHQGLSYFGSIGRRPARVFVSNSSAANSLASVLAQKLALNNIKTFQYKEKNAIETGSNWVNKIKDEANSCDVFVAVIDKGYSESEWCEKELKIAVTRARKGEVALFPYIDPENPPPKGWLPKLLKEDHASDLRKGQAVEDIFKEVDTRLKRKESNRNWQARQPSPLGASREAVIDALRHLNKESWTVLVDKLAREKIAVRVPEVQPKIQPRAIAEELVFGVQRAEITSDMAEKRMSPLSYMVEELTALVDDDRRKPILAKIVKRMRDAFETDE